MRRIWEGLECPGSQSCAPHPRDLPLVMRFFVGGYDARLVKIKAPDEPGDYVLRYWNGDNSVALYEQPVVIE